jgi:hypothetical protein
MSTRSNMIPQYIEGMESASESWMSWDDGTIAFCRTTSQCMSEVR